MSRRVLNPQLFGRTTRHTSVHDRLLKEQLMEYGIGGILLLILVILAIIFLAKRV
ncbi:MAG TPA: hypothetical protein VES40_06445 [Ilumatobacteraceae bacterium]|nr:hypothetical protein [Ilumatobacteraceae bacterium]